MHVGFAEERTRELTHVFAPQRPLPLVGERARRVPAPLGLRRRVHARAYASVDAPWKE